MATSHSYYQTQLIKIYVISTGLFLMCAFSVYVDNVRTQSEEWVLGSGFALTVSAWVAAWGSGVACALQQSAEGK